MLCLQKGIEYSAPSTEEHLLALHSPHSQFSTSSFVDVFITCTVCVLACCAALYLSDLGNLAGTSRRKGRGYYALPYFEYGSTSFAHDFISFEVEPGTGLHWSLGIVQAYFVLLWLFDANFPLSCSHQISKNRHSQ